jgi:hypothetical protein
VPDRTTIPDDLRLLSEDMAERLAGVMSIQLVELAALLVPARNVRAVPAQRFTAGTVTLSADNLPLHKLTGRRQDVARIRLFYAGAPADDGDVIRVAQSPEAAQGSAFTSFALNGITRELVLEVNECDVWLAFGADAAGATGPVAVTWVLEEYDPSGVVD